MTRSLLRPLFYILVSQLICLAAVAQSPAGKWWKGNLHTHSLWSDGDDYPEIIAEWYKSQGYHFLALSDHNIIQKGEKWINVTNQNQRTALQKYVTAKGSDYVVQREVDGKTQVKLKTLQEFRGSVEAPGRFLMIQAMELTDRYKVFPVHINVTHIAEMISPQGGESVYQVMQNNISAVLEQRRRTGQPMIAHLNHPNFGWAVMAEDLARVRGEKFFEVYNGHPQVHNEGDDQRASTDKIWDVVLTMRIAELGLEPLYGLAVDDSHNYHAFAPQRSNAGRGWVMVRSQKLEAPELIAALERGDFYASNGVELEDVSVAQKSYALRIEGEKGVTYKTQFIGTIKGYNPRNEPVKDATGNPLPTTHRYSPDVGAVLSEVEGLQPKYQFQGDELYVRAKVVSSKVKTNGYREGEFETAWTQPVVLHKASPAK